MKSPIAWVFASLLTYYVVGLVVLDWRMRLFFKLLDIRFPRSAPTRHDADSRRSVLFCAVTWPFILVHDVGYTRAHYAPELKELRRRSALRQGER